jgi:hypothetical protein
MFEIKLNQSDRIRKIKEIALESYLVDSRIKSKSGFDYDIWAKFSFDSKLHLALNMSFSSIN